MHSSRILTANSLPYRGSLSGGVSVQEVSVQRCLCQGGSLSRGGLCLEGGLCPGVVSVWGSLSRRGLCPGGLCPGVFVRETPLTVTPSPVDRMTGASRTLPCPKLRLRSVKRQVKNFALCIESIIFSILNINSVPFC